MTRVVTLLIADPRTLLELPEAQLQRLETVLSRGDRRRITVSGWRRVLLAAFGLPVEKELPVSALTRHLDVGDADAGHWLRADPVYMEVAANLAIKRHGDLELSEAHRRALAASLSEYFDGTPFEFSAPTTRRWYLSSPEPFKLATTPPDELVGRDASDGLPDGPDAPAWRRIINETQILLNNHPVNRERRETGQVPINSLWFWGAGPLPRVPGPAFEDIRGGGVLARALQSLAVERGRNRLIVIDAPDDSIESAEEIRRALSTGERLRILLPGAGWEVRWSPRHHFRFWRPRRPWWHWFESAGKGET